MLYSTAAPASAARDGGRVTQTQQIEAERGHFCGGSYRAAFRYSCSRSRPVGRLSMILNVGVDLLRKLVCPHVPSYHTFQRGHGAITQRSRVAKIAPHRVWVPDQGLLVA